MKSNKELKDLFFGIRRIAHVVGHWIFFIGVLIFWSGAEYFSIYLMCLGMGLVLIFDQKVENDHLTRIIRKYLRIRRYLQRRKRRTPVRQEER